ncbi:MAG TPA: hypothetical protein VMM15_42185 [Bradyrhizobium sp.]|nr:hypothetical protein [Bradyrhizobium sp.]
MRVQERHIIYVQGYDPRGLAQYYRMFRTELRKFGRLYQVNSTLGRPQSRSNDEITSWTIETEAEGWKTRTTYDFLRFEDFIQRDLASPIWRTVLRAVFFYWRLVFNGTMGRFTRANWRFATFITYPHFILLLEALAVGAFAFVFEKGLQALGLPLFASAPLAFALFIAVLGILLKYTENQTYVLYLLCDWIWTWEFARRQRPEWDERIDRFADYLCKVARTSDADEIVIVGHSSGSFLGTEIVARALKLDPALGKHGPRIMLLTLGGNYPIVGFHAAAQHFRDHLRELAIEPSVEWIECQARKDVMNFFQLDPLASHGIEVGEARCNPKIVPVRFREIIDASHYNLFRWQFFRVHFQFVMANERPHAYDFFMIVCGPVPLRERMASPQAALTVVTAEEPDRREKAWLALESGVPGRGTAADLTGEEPSARLSR